MADRAIENRTGPKTPVLLVLGLVVVVVLAAVLAVAEKSTPRVFVDTARHMSSVEVNGVHLPYTIDMITGRFGSSIGPFAD